MMMVAVAGSLMVAALFASAAHADPTPAPKPGISNCAESRGARLAALKAEAQFVDDSMNNVRLHLDWITKNCGQNRNGDTWCHQNVKRPAGLKDEAIDWYVTLINDPHEALYRGKWSADNLACDDQDTFAGSMYITVAESGGTIFNITTGNAIRDHGAGLRQILAMK